MNKFIIQIVNMERSRENAPFHGANFRAARSAVHVGNSVYKFVCNSAFADFAVTVPRGTFAEKKVKKHPLRFSAQYGIISSISKERNSQS